MKKTIISKQEQIEFNELFSLDNYLNNKWFLKSNYNIISIEWFDLGDLQQYKKEHDYLRILLKLVGELSLANFPLHSGLPSYNKSLQEILNKHYVDKPSEETKFLFEDVDDFYLYLKKNELYLFDEILYSSNFKLFIIIGIDIGLMFICYNNDLKNEVEDIPLPEVKKPNK